MASTTTPQPSGGRLALLYHLAQTFNSTLDQDQVLNRVKDEVIIATCTKRGFVMLREADERLVFRAARGIDQQTIDDPTFQVSGDYYDIFFALEGIPGLVIADVSDKGMPAALFMGLTRTILRASMNHSASAVTGIARANRLIYADSANSMFVKLFFAQVDPEKDEVTYVNAGHNPPPVYHRGRAPAGSQFHWTSKTGMALGIVPETPYDQEVVRLASGDFMLMYTDGVVDTLDPQGNPFGMEKLQTILLENCNEPAFQLVHALEQALANHVGGLEPVDDITIMAVKRL